MVFYEIILLEVVLFPYFFVKLCRSRAFVVKFIGHPLDVFSFLCKRCKGYANEITMTSYSECIVYRTLSRNVETIRKNVSWFLLEFVNDVCSSTKLSTLLEAITLLDFFMLTFYVVTDTLYSKLDWNERPCFHAVNTFAVNNNGNDNIDENIYDDDMDCCVYNSSCTDLSYSHYIRKSASRNQRVSNLKESGN